ncbi:carbohydrate ABC transporter permease [Sellimonas sp.]|uniref:carbohydrate ABC transporter permease n=1 Tax=Sellimonas sp. TaxID=2021466 RepID=UPI000B38A8C1|nr:carbohydrate ABC transporter permease [Sellimonas sp.]OUP02204.1 lactose ABC transporter permease [Drancourtella sp. An210]OUP65894.1 lactose ABC transporter permease [Drancourtella sp. An177]
MTNKQTVINTGKTRKKVIYAVQYLFLGIISIVSIFPFAWMIIGSTNKSMDITLGKMTFGDQFFINLKNLLEAGDLLTCLKNSAILSIFITCLSMLVCSLAGYGFVVYQSKKKEFFFSLILLSMMIPTSSLVIPMFKMFNGMQLLNTKIGVVLPALSTAFLIFFFRQNTKNFPFETIQSARIDGLGEFGIFFKIYMPMMKSTYAAAAIITFMSSWNNYMWPLISLQTKDQRTLPLLISSLGTAYTPDYGMIMVGIIITTIPSALIFFLMQKNFVNSMMGSVK